MKLTKSDLQQIAKCKKDFKHFIRFCKIVDKRGKLITLKLNTAQHQLFDALESNNWQLVLKARQTGISTFVAAYYLWKALFNTNHNVAIAAHVLDAVRNIFSIYKTIYENLPPQLQLEAKNENANELKFKHGSRIKVGTPNSFRSSTYQSIHCSEVAFWQNPEEDVAALLQTAGENPTIIMESTPNGLNHYHSVWNEDNGYNKLFIGWQTDKSYSRNKQPSDITETERKFIDTLEATTKQKNWAIHTLRTKCAGNVTTFKQEYASDAVTCFITSGTRVFDFTFPNATLTEGYIEYSKPIQYQPYLMGVDVSEGGPQGDYSAFTIITREAQPKIVATYYGKVDSYLFAEEVFQAAQRYNAFVNVEAASAGYGVLNYLKEHEHPHLYRRMIKDKVSSELTEKLGFNTNKKTRAQLMAGLQELLVKKKLNIVDERLQLELNTFVYRQGRPQHDKGKHDDIIFSLALAYVAWEQAEYIVIEQRNKKPNNIQEMLQWEMGNNRLWKEESEGSFRSITNELY